MRRLALLILATSLVGLAQTGGVIIAPRPEPDYSGIATRMHTLEATVAENPNDAAAIRPLALIYARSLWDWSPLRPSVESALNASRNVWVLSNTAYSLRSLYNEGLQRGTDNGDVAELAERYFLRAKAMDPNLDRTAILPVIDLQAIAQKREEEQRTQAAALEKAASEIRRLPVEAFPELPAAVAGTLRGRGCAIPQPSKTRRENVIRGAFFEPGKSGWAVLCSVDGSSSLLVFRDDRDRNPIELGTTEDSGWLQGDVGNTYVFSHQIGVADRAFIERHAQPSFVKPPDVITHVGINDMFLEKGSSVFYYDHGEWLTLPGSD